MTKDEALKLALEALVEVKSWKSPTRWDGCFDKEITAIKEALSSCQCPECRLVLHASDCAVHNEPAYPKGECNCGAQPEQDWSMLEAMQGSLREHMARIKELESQRKPLTDEELRVIENKINPNMRWRSSDEEGITLYPIEYYELVRAIEAAHGIKENI